MSGFQKYYASTSRYYWALCDVTPDTKYPSPLKNFINIFPWVHEEIETIFSRDIWRDSQKPKDTFSVKLCSLEGSTFTSGLNFKFILSNGPWSNIWLNKLPQSWPEIPLKIDELSIFPSTCKILLKPSFFCKYNFSIHKLEILIMDN